ncbi:hypothetical protein VULLAG_LOCUS6837 [Vulpes lagopus]
MPTERGPGGQGRVPPRLPALAEAEGGGGWTGGGGERGLSVGLRVTDWKAAGGVLGRATAGFQWGEEKGAAFATTQQPRSDRCGGIPTCCAVQATGTRTPLRLPEGSRPSYAPAYGCPAPSANLRPPAPNPAPIHTTITASKTPGPAITGLHQHIPSSSQCQTGNRIRVLREVTSKGEGGHLRLEKSPT